MYVLCIQSFLYYSLSLSFDENRIKTLVKHDSTINIVFGMYLHSESSRRYMKNWKLALRSLWCTRFQSNKESLLLSYWNTLRSLKDLRYKNGQRLHFNLCKDAFVFLNRSACFVQSLLRLKPKFQVLWNFYPLLVDR